MKQHWQHRKTQVKKNSTDVLMDFKYMEGGFFEYVVHACEPKQILRQRYSCFSERAYHRTRLHEEEIRTDFSMTQNIQFMLCNLKSKTKLSPFVSLNSILPPLLLSLSFFFYKLEQASNKIVLPRSIDTNDWKTSKTKYITFIKLNESQKSLLLADGHNQYLNEFLTHTGWLRDWLSDRAGLF